MTIKPENWATLKNWSQFDRAAIRRIMDEFTVAFDSLGLTVHFQLWEPPQGSAGFVSMGVQKKGVQPGGNEYSAVFAYGWFARRALTWPKGFAGGFYAQTVKSLYDRFLGPKCEIVSMRIDHDDNLRKFGWTGEKPLDPFEDAPEDPFEGSKPIRTNVTNGYSAQAKALSEKMYPPKAEAPDPFEDDAAEDPFGEIMKPLVKKTMAVLQKHNFIKACGDCDGTGRSNSGRGQCWTCDGVGKMQVIEVDPLS